MKIEKILGYVAFAIFMLTLTAAVYYISIEVAAKYFPFNKPADKVSVQPKAPEAPSDAAVNIPAPLVEKKAAGAAVHTQERWSEHCGDAAAAARTQISAELPVPKIDLSACKLANVKVKQGKSGKATLHFDCPVTLDYSGK